ncbi:hypothetical protein DB30_03907 [Enhygromyxa salina]|uniref:Uncharacterized protein n=1 Tax=Enhygromyxa salina TaxID=215803 RepID=A0A0C2D8A2_9BACT|nr:hypothetical protein DB30_03907 [Enhygromyxa salina]
MFSLDALAGLVSAPARPAPATEGSGLIDIQAMRAMLDREASGGSTRQADHSSDMVPSFAGGRLGGLSADPLVSVAPSPATPNNVGSRSSRGPLYALIGVLGLGVLGLGAVLVLDEPEPEPAAVIASVVGPVGPVEPAEPANDEAPEIEATPTSEPAAMVDAEPTDAKIPTKPVNKPANRPNHKPANKPANKPNTASASPPSKSIDVDCLLNKKLPQCQGDPQPSTPAPDKPAPAPDPDLANKLSQSDILAGVGPIKTAAKTCGSGVAVAVKFSVKGATGGVVVARPLDEHSSSVIGKCVANAAKRATFPKFQAEQQGFTFTFRL